MRNKVKNTAKEEQARPALLPKLRFPEFRGADGWDADALGDVANFVNEKVPLERVTLENYISTENILPDYGGIAKASKLPTTVSVTRYRPNDTLVSNIRPYLKKVWVADKEGGASNDVIVIRSRENLLPQYFSCLLKNDAFIDYVMTGAKGVKMPRGDVGSMKAYRMLYPSKAEQQKIAECLSSVDELLAAQARKVAALKTHKKGLMQQLFPREGETQPRLRFPEFQNAGKWSKMPLGQAAAFYNGRAYKQEELLESGKYPVLRVGNFFTNNNWYHSDLELDQTKYCEKGDLLYAWSASFGPRVWRGEKSIITTTFGKSLSSVESTSSSCSSPSKMKLKT
jgi:type I restriction enzyme S subunit